MYSSESVTTTTNSSSFFDIANNASALWGLMGILLVLFLSFVFLIRFRNKLNNDSAKQVQVFERDQKYIKSLYVELNDTQEKLRYFMFSMKWRQRIVNSFNSMFNDTEGRKLKHLIKSKKFRLPRKSKKIALENELQQYSIYFNDLRNQRTDLIDTLGDYYFQLTNLAYTYARKIDEIKSIYSIALAKELILVGSAGNGKTNTLCNFTNTLIQNGYPCILINSKDVRSKNLFEYFISRLNIPIMVNENYPIYLAIVNFFLYLNRKYLVVCVDAINENDNNDFVSSLGDFLDQLKKYGRIKIVMTCRSEYFEARYKKYFEHCISEPTVLDIRSHDYGKRAKRHVFQSYEKHFKFAGHVSTNAKIKLFQSLILMRVFFEVYANRSDNVVDLNNYEIYQKYVNKLSQENESIDFMAFLSRVVSRMIDSTNYSGVPVDELKLSPEEYNCLKNVFDNNLLITRSVIANKGLITESTEEYVYFVFDELRDFCVTKHLLTLEQSEDFTSLFSVCDELYRKHKSPLEGILKYSYTHFKTIGRFDLCQQILETYCSERVHYWKFEKNTRLRSEIKESFSDFGVTIIFADSANIQPFEKKYLLAAMKLDSRTLWQIFFYLIANELEEVSPGSEILVDIICMAGNYNDFTMLFSYLIQDNYEYHSNDEDRLEYQIIRALEQFDAQGIELSVSLKQFVLLLFAACSTNYMLDEYVERVIAEPGVVEATLDRINIPEVKDSIDQMKLRFTSPGTQSSYRILTNLLQHFGIGEENDDQD